MNELDDAAPPAPVYIAPQVVRLGAVADLTEGPVTGTGSDGTFTGSVV